MTLSFSVRTLGRVFISRREGLPSENEFTILEEDVAYDFNGIPLTTHVLH